MGATLFSFIDWKAGASSLQTGCVFIPSPNDGKKLFKPTEKGYDGRWTSKSACLCFFSVRH